MQDEDRDRLKDAKLWRAYILLTKLYWQAETDGGRRRWRRLLRALRIFPRQQRHRKLVWWALAAGLVACALINWPENSAAVIGDHGVDSIEDLEYPGVATMLGGDLL